MFKSKTWCVGFGFLLFIKGLTETYLSLGVHRALRPTTSFRCVDNPYRCMINIYYVQKKISNGELWTWWPIFYVLMVFHRNVYFSQTVLRTMRGRENHTSKYVNLCTGLDSHMMGQSQVLSKTRPHIPNLEIIHFTLHRINKYLLFAE